MSRAVVASLVFSVALIAGCSTSPSASSHDTNQAVQDAMRDYVTAQTAATGRLPIVHQGKVLQLELATSEEYPDGFHAGVSTHGNLYTSCADFRDPATGTQYDIDFLVNRTDGRFHVVQPIVHKIDGVKSPYDLAH